MPNSRRDRVPPPEGYRLCNRAEKDCINGYVHEDDPFKTCEACRAKRRNQRERQKMTAVFNEQLVIHPELLEATEEDVITTTDRSTAALLEAGGQQYRPEPTPPPPAARPAKRKKVIKEVRSSWSASRLAVLPPPQGREVTRGITPYPSRAACVDALQEAYNQLELGSTEDFLFHGSFFDDACEFRNAEVAPDKRTADAYLHTIRADIARALEMVFTCVRLRLRRCLGSRGVQDARCQGPPEQQGALLDPLLLRPGRRDGQEEAAREHVRRL
jgi:hypothetical protein